MRWLHSCWEELFSCCFNTGEVVKYAFCPVLCISLCLEHCKSLQGLNSRLGLAPGHWIGQVVQDQREHLHCMDQITTCCDTLLIQRASIACKVCAASCFIMHQN